jgi:formamidopyrimidine-DNA glycosylase
MPELPEIYLLSSQMKTGLRDKTIAGVEVLQPKCLNVSAPVFKKALVGAGVNDVTYRGKWIFVETTQGWLLLCLGMGGEILLTTRSTLPKKYRLIFDFTDHTCLAVNFWWFGYAHYAKPNQLQRHTMTASLGPNALDLDVADFHRLLEGRRGRLKAFLLDQSKIAGIGNFYIHDILFRGRLHPLRMIDSLSDAEITALAAAVRTRLQLSVDKGGAAFEVNLSGQKGSFGMEDLVIAYKEGQPCPVCGSTIEKIKTGGTSSFVCPECQPLHPDS